MIVNAEVFLYCTKCIRVLHWTHWKGDTLYYMLTRQHVHVIDSDSSYSNVFKLRLSFHLAVHVIRLIQSIPAQLAQII